MLGAAPLAELGARFVTPAESRSYNALRWRWQKLLAVLALSAVRASCLHRSLGRVRPFGYVGFTRWSLYAPGSPLVGSRHASRWWSCLQCLGIVMPFDGVGRTPQRSVLPVLLVMVVMRACLIVLLKCALYPSPAPLCVGVRCFCFISSPVPPRV